jgi:hypothetical protein
MLAPRFMSMLALAIIFATDAAWAETATSLDTRLVGTWRGLINGELPFHITFRSNRTWTMQLVNDRDAQRQTGIWQFAGEVLVIRTDGRRDVVRHPLMSLSARKATFDPGNPYTLTRVR